MGNPRRKGAQSEKNEKDSDAESTRTRSRSPTRRGEEEKEYTWSEASAEWENFSSRERRMQRKMEVMFDEHTTQTIQWNKTSQKLEDELKKQKEENKQTIQLWKMAENEALENTTKLITENEILRKRVAHIEEMLEKLINEKDLKKKTNEEKAPEKEHTRREKEKQKDRMETNDEQGFELVENKRKRPTTIKEIEKEQREEKKAKKQGTEQEKGKDNRERRPPPIIIRNAADKWRKVQEGLKTQEIKYKPGTYKAQQGMKIHPETSDDYRKARRYLDTLEEVQWYSFNLQEEKSRKIVIKGLLETDNAEEVLKALNEEGYSPKRVTQLRSRYGDRRMLPIFLVELDSSEEVKIRKLEYLMDMRVKIEELKKPDTPLQCYRCQGFHHGQSSCRLLEKCVACGGEHRSTECKRPKEEKPTCANCQGEHPANYRGCPKAPKKTTWKPSVAPPPLTKSYAEAAQPAAAATKMMDTIMKTVMEKINQVLEEFARGMAK